MTKLVTLCNGLHRKNYVFEENNDTFAKKVFIFAQNCYN